MRLVNGWWAWLMAGVSVMQRANGPKSKGSLQQAQQIVKQVIEYPKLTDHDTSIHSDDLSAITLSHDTTYHARWNINVAYHFIHEKVVSNTAALTYIRSNENSADLMMKGLEMNQHQYLCRKLGFGGMSELCWVDNNLAVCQRDNGGLLWCHWDNRMNETMR